MDIKRKLLSQLLGGQISLQQFRLEMSKFIRVIYILPDDDSFDKNKPVRCDGVVYPNMDALSKTKPRGVVIVEQADEKEKETSPA